MKVRYLAGSLLSKESIQTFLESAQRTDISAEDASPEHGDQHKGKTQHYAQSGYLQRKAEEVTLEHAKADYSIGADIVDGLFTGYDHKAEDAKRKQKHDQLYNIALFHERDLSSALR